MSKRENFFAGSSVKLLTSSDFENTRPWILKDKRCSFVLFFAPWCGHCMAFKEPYKQFANEAQFIHVYAINSDENKALLDKINKSPQSIVKIKGYPTLWIYSNGEPLEEYDRDRTKEALINKAIEICNTECECSKRK